MSELSIGPKTLEQIPLFKNFNETERHQLSDVAKIKHFAPGELVVKQGQTNQALWVLLEGRCEVFKYRDDTPADSVVLAVLQPYAHFGEMSFFSPAPHSANVRAQTAVELMCIARSDYDDLIGQGVWAAYKLAHNTVQSLADRLRRMDEWVAELASQNPPDARVPEWSSFRDKLFNGWNL